MPLANVSDFAPQGLRSKLGDQQDAPVCEEDESKQQSKKAKRLTQRLLRFRRPHHREQLFPRVATPRATPKTTRRSKRNRLRPV